MRSPTPPNKATTNEAVRKAGKGEGRTIFLCTHNLDEAERWYQLSLEKFDAGDWKGRSGCYHQLGSLAYERFKVAMQVLDRGRLHISAYSTGSLVYAVHLAGAVPFAIRLFRPATLRIEGFHLIAGFPSCGLPSAEKKKWYVGH